MTFFFLFALLTAVFFLQVRMLYVLMKFEEEEPPPPPTPLRSVGGRPGVAGRNGMP